jgi:NADPH-dependent curcumin reductase CurA
VLDAVLPRLNVGARVPVCGLIAYNDTGLPPSPDRMPQLLGLVLRKRLLLQGFIISDHYADGFTAFQCDMGGWVAAGKVSSSARTSSRVGARAAGASRPAGR